MMRILKYALPLAGFVVIRTGKRGRVLAVGFQSGSPVLWVEAEVGDTEELRVWVGLTGDEVPEGAVYVGSAQLTTPQFTTPYYVVHVYVMPDSPRAAVRPSPEPQRDPVVQPPSSTSPGLIAYARIEQRTNGNWYAICPECSVHVLLRDLKDQESFTKREYIEHYASAHAG